MPYRKRRPPRPGETGAYYITTAFRTDEAAAVLALAKREGITVSGLIRRIVVPVAQDRLAQEDQA